VANASAEKFKALALRHGEKAVMAVTTMLCLFFLYYAVTRPTIELTPDQVQTSASQAESNLNREQKKEDILKVLEEQQIKNPGFEQIVEQQAKNLLVAADFRPRQLWVTPEPGAGLIRDQPELIAATELHAYPGRGGALVWALDESGARVPDPDAGKTQDEATKQRRARGGRGGRRKMDEERKKKEEEKKREREEQQKKAAVVGIVKKEDGSTETAQAEAPSKEVTKGVRWVAITGVLNYKILRDNYLSALKRPEAAYPHFKQLDIERQVKQSDGSWADWEAIDVERNRQILDNLPEESEEWTPENVRISALVNPLPFLKAGFWERVHVARMVPQEKLEVPKIQYQYAAGGSSAGMPGDTVPMLPPEATSSRASMPEMAPAMAMEGTSGGMYGPGESINFEKTEADEVMIRALDFTAEPDTTYRFRVRIVVFNPNRGREDIAPGVDKDSVELFGPWSEPTEEVTMPSDVATYAINKEPVVPRKLDLVNFEVARWTPDDGVTVVKRFPAAPGEIIGEYRSADVPTNDNGVTKTHSRRIDFNSHHVVLDVIGGDQPIPALGPGASGGRLAVPAVTLLVRPDGAVVVRNQASDLHDKVRKDMWDNYNRELKAAEDEKNKKGRPTAAGGSSAPP
jgi:hypothetical protein